MATLKRIDPGSAFKVGGILYALMGLLLGIVFALVSTLGAIVPASETGLYRMFFGVGAIVFLPIFYGIIGAIFAAISAAVYNLVAEWVGGLEVDVS